jgi:hypothetical protein
LQGKLKRGELRLCGRIAAIGAGIIIAEQMKEQEQS